MMWATRSDTDQPGQGEAISQSSTVDTKAAKFAIA